MDTPGNLYICNICTYQERVQDADQENGCLHPQPAMEESSCDGFRLLPGNGLGERLAELYELVTTMCDLVLDLSESVQKHLQPEEAHQP